jgi:hypothetical protein
MSYYDVDEESRTRTTAYFARQDCERYNSEHKHLYTKDQILSGEMLKRAAEIAYFRSRVFLNYREKFMTVKVEAPQIADKISDEVEQLLVHAGKTGSVVKHGKASVIFEFAHR